MKWIIVLALIALAVAQTPPKDDNCWKNRPKVRPPQCCTGLTLITDAAKATCKTQYPDSVDKDDSPRGSANGSEKSFRRGHFNSCADDCYFNQTGIFKNGKLDKATAVTVLGRSLDASLKSKLTAAIDTCVTEGENFKKAFGDAKRSPPGGPGGRGPRPSGDDDKEDRKRCRPDAFFLLKCVEGQLYKACPAAKKVSSTDCSALDTFIATCKPGKKN